MPMRFKEIDPTQTNWQQAPQRRLAGIYTTARDLAIELAALLSLNPEDTPEELRPPLEDAYKALKAVSYAFNDTPTARGERDWDPPRRVVGVPFTARARH